MATQPIVRGDVLPPVTLPTADGGSLALNDLRGKQVLLFCWASW